MKVQRRMFVVKYLSNKKGTWPPVVDSLVEELLFESVHFLFMNSEDEESSTDDEDSSSSSGSEAAAARVAEGQFDISLPAQHLVRDKILCKSLKMF